jgi:cysteinyl-tRNA synthetase
MFVCGPTVYDAPHIGHGRSYVCFDVVAKYLRYLGYDVIFNINITDIDDKVIKKAQEENTNYENVAQRYGLAFDEALCTLGVDSINGQYYATDSMDCIIYQISELERKGFTYMLDDGLYFDLAKFPEHGKLSGRIGAGLEESDVSRIGGRTDKRNPGDFVLWKLEKAGEREVGAVWDVNPETGEPIPWGPGRPGWHIEDTAITDQMFGPQYDIHGGGIDLVFPHHEAEICQMEAASGESPLVNFWMHNGHLMIDKHKMSKSLKNFMTIDEAAEKWGAYALRYFFISAHYRSPLNFTDEAMDAAAGAVERLNNFILTMKQFKEKGPEPKLLGYETGEISAIGRETFVGEFYHIENRCTAVRRYFETCMNNDFNVSGALAIIHMWIKEIYARIEKERNGVGSGCNGEHFSKFDASMVLEQLHAFDKILGVMNFELKIPEDVLDLVAEREVMRDGKLWDKSDALRAEINALGYTLDDTTSGTIVRKEKKED